jgi:cytoskeletal protein CcmA (bactofilin family)
MDASQSAPEKPSTEGANNPEPVDSDENSLEGTSSSSNAITNANPADKPNPQKSRKPGGLKQKFKQFNLYLLLFVFVLLLSGVIIIVGYFQSEQSNNQTSVKNQTLTQNTLDKVASSDANIGNSQEVLNVDSSAVFAGQVLVRNDLQVAGSLEIGGTVALTNLTVGGTTSLGQLSISKNLALTGNAAIQGAVAIAGSLQVNGAGTFSGALSASQLTTANLQLNGNLVLTHHISAGGPTPNHTTGSAVGNGGTATVGGSDTSGSVIVNTGSTPSAGCFITVNFSQPFDETPHVVITPVGVDAAGIAYYVNRDVNSFSVCDATNPPSGSSFSFDYFIVE